MKQIQFEQFGAPSQVTRCVDVSDVGPPSAWEVVVDVEAFPINVADLSMLAGRYGTLPKLPSTIGMEGAGRVVQCGSAVKEVVPGDRVILLANNNWTQRRKLPARAVHKVPEHCDPMQMAMLKVNPATAYLMLHQCKSLAADEWILQNAPLSSVGSCVIQIAKANRWRTINIVRRAESIPAVLALGGDVVLEDGPDLAQRVRAAIRQEPVQLALDAVAGPGISRIAECLSEGGTIVNYGMLSGESCVLSAEQTIFRGISLQGFWLSKTLNRMLLPERTELFGSLTDLAHQGKLSVQIDSTFSIDDIRLAVSRAEQGNRRGKVLVLPNGIPQPA